ncbi:MAG TPA: class I SAM-dependent methyltransferase [Verrucomicrobiae bacterium]|nr:class I SAM-dependent methyltransferase [Verrucomicrobiae bacterium]
MNRLGGILRRTALRLAVLAAGAVALIVATGFPYDVDKPLSAEELAKNRNYYAEAYRKEAPAEAQPATEYDTRYVQIAARAADAHDIKGQVARFVDKYALRNGAMLDIGSGRGYLQDVVENYTGLDISSSVGRFYHKKFVLGSATAMPFPDNSFDGGWSIWVLEHVPNPEQALSEMRRVMKNNAVFFWYPAWNCRPWFAEGYQVRPFSDFDWKGKLTKASIPLRDSYGFIAVERVSIRSLRSMAAWFGPTRLHYRLLQPNYKVYWQGDSDALNNIDRYEAMLWFTSRGDECLNCEGRAGGLRQGDTPALVIRVRK